MCGGALCLPAQGQVGEGVAETMPGKVKMKCPRCHKMFKASSAKQNLCDECVAKEHAARVAAKAAPVKVAPAPPVKPLKVTGPGAGILVPGLAHTATPTDAPAPESGLFGADARRQEEADRRAAANPPPNTGARPGQGAQSNDHSDRTVVSDAATPKARPERPPKPRKAEKPPRPPREPRPAPQPFQLSAEQRTQVEARYLELAQPIEFDGIRSQIATELGLPKSVVKKAVSDLRASMQLPSWWDLQAFTGAPADLERIRVAYLPLLPTPEIGAHKQIAEALGIDPRQVYQGIRRIRAEMRLPQYNPPDAHPESAAQFAAQPGAVAATDETATTTETKEVASA